MKPENKPIDHGEFAPGIKDPDQFASLVKKYLDNNLQTNKKDAKLRTDAQVARLKRLLDQPCPPEIRSQIYTELAVLREVQIAMFLKN